MRKVLQQKDYGLLIHIKSQKLRDFPDSERFKPLTQDINPI